MTDNSLEILQRSPDPFALAIRWKDDLIGRLRSAEARALAAESKLARLEEWAQAFLKATPRELMDAAAIKGMKATLRAYVSEEGSG